MEAVYTAYDDVLRAFEIGCDERSERFQSVQLITIYFAPVQLSKVRLRVLIIVLAFSLLFFFQNSITITNREVYNIITTPEN